MDFEIHRAPVCALTRLWELDARTISNQSSLHEQQQKQQRVVWSDVDVSAISFAHGAMVVSANDHGSSFQFSFANCTETDTLYRLSLQVRFPQVGTCCRPFSGTTD